MLPLVVDKKVAECTVVFSVKPAMLSVGATPVEFGTATSKNQGLAEMPLPFFSIPIDVEPTAMVSPPTPFAVVHAGTVAGGGQKPTGSVPSARAGEVHANADAKVTSRTGNSTFFNFHSPFGDRTSSFGVVHLQIQMVNSYHSNFLFLPFCFQSDREFKDPSKQDTHFPDAYKKKGFAYFWQDSDKSVHKRPGNT
jgi:hypothetical protein